jgi:hypothetical protein
VIRVIWLDPNWKFWARTPTGKEETHFCYAESAEALRKRLQARQWEPLKIEQYDFSEWRSRAAEATMEVMRDYDRRTQLRFRSRLWKDLKWHLFDLFNRKCAYCEFKPEAGGPGSVEHYRPKGRVAEDEGHPGYYWLAYEIGNLLPCCNACNSAKKNHFPVEGAHGRNPTMLMSEQPLLLNPFDQDPTEHLWFDERGFARPKSASGSWSIRCYELNREALRDSRFVEMRRIWSEWSTVLGILGCEVADLDRHRTSLVSKAYTAALLCQLDRLARME